MLEPERVQLFLHFLTPSLFASIVFFIYKSFPSCNVGSSKHEEAKQGVSTHSCKNCSNDVETFHGKDSSEVEVESMMVQPNFNISETVEVVHMGPTGQ